MKDKVKGYLLLGMAFLVVFIPLVMAYGWALTLGAITFSIIVTSMIVKGVELTV